MTSAIDNFPEDYLDLLEQANAHQVAVKKKKDYADEFNSVVLAKLRSFAKSDPMMMFLALFVFASTGVNKIDGKTVSKDATIFGQMDNKLGITGKSLLTMSGLAKIGNDLENMSNDPNGTPADLRTYARHLDTVITELSNKDSNLAQSIDHIARTSLITNFRTLRSDIHIGSGPFDGDAATAHFDPSAPNIDPKSTTASTQKMNSFGELQKLMGEKGNPGGATDAAQLKTDAFNTNTSTVQSVNAALNVTITQDTNMQKNVQAFYASFLHFMQDQNKAILSNMGR